MIVRYKTDFYASYMLVEIPQEADCEQYSFRMLEKNRIQGVLSCKERMEDGRAYLYMDISGKKNLLQEYKDKKMELEDMILIFQQLLPILEELRKYLLTEKMAILEPEYIFRDMEDGSLHMTILPWEREEEQSLHKLAEFFLEKINHKDEYGVNAAYHFYRQQSQPHFSLYHFIPVLEKENILKRQQRKELQEIKPSVKIEERNTEDCLWESPAQVLKTQQGAEIENKKKGFLGILLLIFAILLLLFGFLPLVKTKQKIYCLLLSMILFVTGFLIKLIQSMKNKEKTEEKIREDIVLEKEIVNLEKGMEETVFFESDLSEDLLKLQWKEKGRVKQVVLREFPCTVGKIKEEVSVVIDHPSVSRVHCRFVEKDMGVAIMDLDSTNGTYLNGIQLKEGELLEIVKNDEILIGKVKVLVV